MKSLSVLGMLIAFVGSMAISVAAPDLSLEREAKKLLAPDISAMRHLAFDDISEAHRDFFGTESQPLAGFFSSRIRHYGWDDDAPPGVLAYIRAPDIMVLGPSFQKLPQLARIVTLLHEAHHLAKKKAVHPHVFCPDPYFFQFNNRTYRLPSFGVPTAKACDNSDTGGYALDYVFFRSISDSCTNCSEKMRMDARIYETTASLVRIANSEAVARLVARANLEPKRAVLRFEKGLEQEFGPGR